MHIVIAKSLRVAAFVSKIPVPFLTPRTPWFLTRIIEATLRSTRNLSAHLHTALSTASPPVMDLRRALYSADMQSRCPPALRAIRMPLNYGVHHRDAWIDYLCQKLTTVVALVEEGTEAGCTAIDEVTYIIDDTLEEFAEMEKLLKQRTSIDGLSAFSTRSLYEAALSHLESIRRVGKRLQSTDRYLFALTHTD